MLMRNSEHRKIREKQKNYVSYLDTSRGLRHGHGGQDLHDRRAGDRLRHQRKRDLRADPGRLRTGLTRRNT